MVFWWKTDIKEMVNERLMKFTSVAISLQLLTGGMEISLEQRPKDFAKYIPSN